MATSPRKPSSRRPAPAAASGAPADDAARPESAEEAFGQDIDEAAEELIQECSEVHVRVNWFGTSAKVDDDLALEMLKDTDAERKAVSISKRLMSTKHEAMLVVKEARKAIDDHVAAWTIPMLAVRVSTGQTDEATRKDAGVRLIKKKDMAEFDQRIQYLAGVLRTAAETLQEKMPEIKAADREKLGRLYKDDDYPKDVTKLIGVEVRYKPCGTDVDWERLCPEVYEREKVQAKARFSAVVENAAVEFASRFVKYVKMVTDQLGNRTRLNPVAGSEQAVVVGPDDKEVTVNVRDAEVMARVTHEIDEEVPEGKVLLQLRLAKEGKGRSTEVWLKEPVTTNHFHTKLQPYETEERKKLYASTVDNLKRELETFLNIGEMLGPYREIVAAGVEKVKGELTKASSNLNTDQISSALREGSYFRTELKSALEGVASTIEKAMGTTQKVRRRVILTPKEE